MQTVPKYKRNINQKNTSNDQNNKTLFTIFKTKYSQCTWTQISRRGDVGTGSFTYDLREKNHLRNIAFHAYRRPWKGGVRSRFIGLRSLWTCEVKKRWQEISEVAGFRVRSLKAISRSEFYKLCTFQGDGPPGSPTFMLYSTCRMCPMCSLFHKTLIHSIQWGRTPKPPIIDQ